MSEQELFSFSIYKEQARLEDGELSAFINAVIGLYGPGLGRSATENWLREADLLDEPPRSTCRDWRSVTIAASALLSDQIDAPEDSQNLLIASINPKTPPTLSSNCSR